MKIETIRTLVKTLENVASDDETRFHLGCAEINNRSIVATDGHILSEIEHQDDSLTSIEPVYVHKNQLPMLKAWLKMAPRYALDVEFEFIGTDFRIKDLNPIVFKLTTDIKYPNYRQFIPKNQESILIGFNADLLMSLVKTLKNGKVDCCKLEIKFSTELDNNGKVTGYKVDNLAPLIVKSSGNGQGVLMPMNV